MYMIWLDKYGYKISAILSEPQRVKPGKIFFDSCSASDDRYIFCESTPLYLASMRSFAVKLLHMCAKGGLTD